MRRLTSIVVLAAFVSGAPVPARAQDAGTRAGQAEQQRAEKAKQIEPYSPGKVERGLLLLEQRFLGQRLLGPPRGFFTRLGGMPEGQGFTLGPAYRYSNQDVSFTTTAALSIKAAYEVTARLELPRPPLPPARQPTRFLSAGGLFHRLPQEDFYGFGQQSSPSTRTSFLLDESAFDVTAGLSPVRWFTVSGTAEYRTERAGGGEAAGLPSIEVHHSGSGAPAAQTDLDFVRIGGQTFFDLANAPQRAPVGGRYRLSAYKYLDQTDQYSFNRWEVDLQQYVPIFTPSRLIALRANAVGVVPDAGQDVPFYLQPTLGGSHSIRGYPYQRFRDRHSLLLQAEYRFVLNDFMTGAVFYDTGKVAFDRQDLWDFNDLRDDYGISVRFGFAGLAAFRAEVVFGGDEGTVYALRFSDVF